MSEDEDFERNPVKNKAKGRSSGRQKPSDGVVGPAVEVPARATPSDQWVEVFLEVEKRWVAVDCVHSAVDRLELCVRHATKPLRYIVGFDGQGCVRDVTQRYDTAWMTATRKIRVDAVWWDQTLSPYRSTFTQRDMLEDREVGGHSEGQWVNDLRRSIDPLMVFNGSIVIETGPTCPC